MLKSFTPVKNIRVGYIGLGNHALENLLPSILLTPNLQLVAISSRDEEKMIGFAERFKPQLTTTNWQEIIDPNLVDLVVVSATPEIHFQIAQACIRSGVHCFIEKPPTLNLTELKLLVELEKSTNVKTFVGYNYTYSDAYNKLLSSVSLSSPVSLAKFRFIVGKLNQPVDGFKTVLESGLYKMFTHPMHTLYQTFGEYSKLEVVEQVFNDNKFFMQVILEFKNGGKALLDWGNYSNRFECRFELTNNIGETGVLDNMGHYELWNMQQHSFDKKIFKSKERLVFDNSPLLGGFERTGYQREFELLAECILNDTPSPCSLAQSLEVYRAAHEIMQKSKIGF